MKDRLTPMTFVMWLCTCVMGYVLVVGPSQAPQAQESNSMCEYKRYYKTHKEYCKSKGANYRAPSSK